MVKSWFTLHYTENKDYQLQSRRAESLCPSVSLREIIVDDRIMNATCGRTATNLNCEKASFLYNQVIDDKLS